MTANQTTEPEINQARAEQVQGGAPSTATSPDASKDMPPLPDDAIILVPVRNVVLFPGIVVPLSLGRTRTIAAAQEAARAQRPLGVILQRDAGEEDPAAEQLYTFGTVAGIMRYVTAPDGAHHIVVQGQQRFRTIEYLPGYPFLVARIERIEEPETSSPEIEARLVHLKERTLEALQYLPQAPRELAAAIQAIPSPAAGADLVASFMDIKVEEKQEILETIDVKARLDRVLQLLSHAIEVLRLTRDISEQTRESVDSRQREYILREQLRTIQKELGEDEGTGAEIAELDKAIAEAKMPEEVEVQARKELKRLERMPEAAAERSMVRTYLDWLIELPWSVLSEDNIDIAEARRVLDEEHYGLAKIKRRILEYLAVRKLNPTGKSPILCFVGPPGVGKTSLGQSIAHATGRKFVRASLGGVHDEAEIRGHRRTYIGALPGNVVQSIRKAGTRNPVFMLDEMDKLGASFHGDPSSALLEVLDPEQNSTFRDNYLAVPFDLSQVMFIGTANVLDQIPGPLRDRMEVIELPSYTEDEKVQIAQRYLVKRQLESNGLTAEQAELSEPAIRAIVRDYTREAGVRNLERLIGGVFRSAAMRIAEGTAARVAVEPEDLHGILGAQAGRERGGAAHQRAGRRDRPRLDAGRRRHPVRRGDPDSGQGPADPDRPARRRHEGERPGGAEPREVARAADGHQREPVREERHPRPRAGRRDPQGRAVRRRRDVHGPGLAADRPDRARRHGDDRRDQPARPRAAGRRHQGEGACGAPRRDQARAAAGAQPQGLRGHPGERAQRAGVRLARAGRRRDRRRPRRAGPHTGRGDRLIGGPQPPRSSSGVPAAQSGQRPAGHRERSSTIRCANGTPWPTASVAAASPSVIRLAKPASLAPHRRASSRVASRAEPALTASSANTTRRPARRARSPSGMR